jgi:antitoxin PrlF
MSTTVTSKGQVTIPKPVRDYLGLEPGTKVEFVDIGNGEYAVRREDWRTSGNRFSKLRGTAGPGPTTDELMTMLRGDED